MFPLRRYGYKTASVPRALAERLASPSTRPTYVRHRVEGGMRVHGTEFAGDTGGARTCVSGVEWYVRLVFSSPRSPKLFSQLV